MEILRDIKMLFHYVRIPLIRKLVIRTSNYPDRLDLLGKFVNNSTKLICPEITGYRIKYSRVLWLVELQIRRGRKVQTQLHTVNSNSRISNCQCSVFSKKNPVIRIFCISGCLATPIKTEQQPSTIYPSCYTNLLWPLGVRHYCLLSRKFRNSKYKLNFPAEAVN